MKPAREPRQNGRGVFVAGGVGFEPTTTGLGGLRPILTRLPAHAFRHCLTSLVL